MDELKESIETDVSRRSVLKKGAAVGALAVVGTAASGSAVAQTPGKATGGVDFTTAGGGDAKASFNAHGDDHPRGPRGRVNVRGHGPTGDVDFKGTVDCYFQSGNLARFSGEITRINGASSTHYRITVQDNGEPGDEPPEDMITVERAGSSLDCTAPVTANRPVEGGNLQVHE